MSDGKDLSHLVRPHLLHLVPYSSARHEQQSAAGTLFLDANENALGSVGGLDLSRYPDPEAKVLKDRIGERMGLARDQVFVGQGSQEAIDLLIRIFCEPGADSILVATPTFGMYKVSASSHKVHVLEAPLDERFQLPLQSIQNLWSKSVKLTFLCSPNNPSGNLLDEKDVEFIIRRGPGIVVLDEAYIDFAGGHSWAERLADHPNLVVLQTFSKAWGLASLRIGVALSSPFINRYLLKIKAPYNVSGPIQKMLLSRIGFSDEVKARAEQLVRNREIFARQLAALEEVERVYPSDANFLLVRFRNSTRAMQGLKEKKIIVRDLSTRKGCHECLRITVGTRDENERVVSTLQGLKPKP